MTFIKAFSTLGCPEHSLDEVFALAVRHEISAVELRALSGTVDLPEQFRRVFGNPANLADQIRKEAIRIVSFDTSFALAGHTSADRDSLLAFVPWAEAVGVAWLRVFDGHGSGAGTAVAEAAECVRWWQALRKENGWHSNLMVETHDSLLDTGTIRQFVKGAPEAAILWDAHHTWRNGEDPVSTWHAIHSRVVHIHVKDSVSRQSGRHPCTYVLPGEGEFPIAPLLAKLDADKFTGPVSLEWEKMWHPCLPTLEDALRAAVRNRWW